MADGQTSYVEAPPGGSGFGQSLDRLTLERARRGVIVNNASIWGVVSPDPKMYLDLENEPPLFLPVAKAGIIQLTKYLAVLYAPKGIRVNTITPGLFPQRRGPDRPDYMQELNSRIPMGRIGAPSVRSNWR